MLKVFFHLRFLPCPILSVFVHVLSDRKRTLSALNFLKFKLHVAILVTFLQFKLLVNLAILTLYQIIEITSMHEIEYLLTPFETPRAMNTCEPYLKW